MRYLVTGASGFIGANLVKRLKDQGHWVRAVDVKTTPGRAFLTGQADEYNVFDLRRPGSAIDALDDVDRVFHLAADHGGAGYFYSDADFKASMNNLTIDRNVLAAACESDVERLLFASSACSYPTTIQDGAGVAPLRESDWGPGPAEQLYGEAKRMSTLLMEGSPIDARCALFHTIYGPTQDHLEPRAKYPTALCRKLLETPTRVELWGDGTQVRTFLYISDALDRIQAVMEHDSYEGPVNVGSSEEVSVRECAEWTAEHAGLDPEWVWIDGPRGVDHRAADNTEFNRRYGERPLVSARVGFAATYDWLYRARRNEAITV